MAATSPLGKIHEVLLDGPAGTGKTLGIGHFLHWVACEYPGARIAIVRKTLTSLRNSVQVTYEDKVLWPEHPIILGASRHHRTHYTYPNRSVLELHGMDQATRLLSTEYDIVYVNEAIELQLAEWEMLHRCLRNGAVPFQMLLGDTNPGPPAHWLKVRCDTGVCRRLRSHHRDNPAMPPDYLADLGRALTGVRRKRLLEGLWAAAEGQVWEDWDDDAHVISCDMEYGDDGEVMITKIAPGDHGLPDKPIQLRWFLGAQDIGWDSPGCAQLYGFDSEKRAYCVAECYRRHWHYEDWAKMWAEWWASYQPIRKIVTDWDEEFQHRIKKLLRLQDTPGLVGKWSKKRGKSGEKTGIDAVRRRLRKRGDGTRGIYFLRDRMHSYPDPDLAKRGHPLRFEDEVAAWVYPPFEERVRHDEPEPDPLCPDHACDTVRGAMDWAEGKDLSAREQPRGVIPGSARDVLDRAKRGQDVI